MIPLTTAICISVAWTALCAALLLQARTLRLVRAALEDERQAAQRVCADRDALIVELRGVRAALENEHRVRDALIVELRGARSTRSLYQRVVEKLKRIQAICV